MAPGLVTDNAKFERACTRPRAPVARRWSADERAGVASAQAAARAAGVSSSAGGRLWPYDDRARGATSRRWQDGGEVDVSKETARLTLSIAASTLFDVDIDSDADDIGTALTDVLQSFWLLLLPFSDVVYALPIAAIRKAKAARGRLDALIYRMVQQRRGASKRRSDVLSMLIEAHEEDGALTDDEVRDEVMTLLGGSRDDGERADVDVVSPQPVA